MARNKQFARHLECPVDQPECRVVANRALIWHIANPAVRRTVVPLLERPSRGLSQLLDRPVCHPSLS